LPYEAFDTADLPLLICCGNDRLFVKLATALGRTAWSTDPRFVTNRARLAHKAELMHELIPLLQQQSRSHWLALLDAAGVPCSPIHSLQEALVHEQVQALELMREVPHDGFRLTAMPLLIDGQRPAPAGPAPSLGEHNGHSFAPTPPHL
jgi:formyl-CoA transferase